MKKKGGANYYENLWRNVDAEMYEFFKIQYLNIEFVDLDNLWLCPDIFFLLRNYVNLHRKQRKI